MPDPMPVATYRLQLRCGVDLDRARALLPWLVELGVSHLYLSPPFHAASGSTHGYDVVDPTRIDPVLGGEEAFAALADAARLAGIGVIIDIVPNHMAFTPENPFLADIMRHGQGSRHARIFDIDWNSGPIRFPVLGAPLEELLEAGQIALAGSAEDPRLRLYERDYPLRQTPLATSLAGTRLSPETLDALLAEQHWTLGHWRTSANEIVHRRFFNITDLIGVRQEDPEVFALTHSWITRQVVAGRVQGLRVDHVDGLARPGEYLDRLRGAVAGTGANVPVWIEKIVKPGEEIPQAWPVEGMSGYEFMSPITRLLTSAEGLAAMRRASEGAVPASTAQEVRKVRRELLDEVFVPELGRVTEAARAELAIGEAQRPALREAVARLAIAWPVYRSYAADLLPLSAQIDAAVGLAEAGSLDAALLGLLRAPGDASAFAARFEQLTGALTAKSEEDTVFFRSVAYLPFCEVGSEPDLDPMTVGEFEAAMASRARETPLALDALSTHDTKRAADARAVLMALSHFPQAAAALYHAARERAREQALPERWGIYAVQTALMLNGQDDAAARITAHIAKAMREAKDLSRHEEPDEDVEAAVAALACEFDIALSDGSLLPADTRAGIEAAAETIVLAQVALQITAPGVPDIYQGTEIEAPALTDPDNRRPVAWDDIAAMEDAGATLSQRKLALTRALMTRRRAAAQLFTHGSYWLTETGAGLEVRREWQGETFAFTIPVVAPAPAEPCPAG